jgi:cell wall-associated NlpC family hydrolase
MVIQMNHCRLSLRRADTDGNRGEAQATALSSAAWFVDRRHERQGDITMKVITRHVLALVTMAGLGLVFAAPANARTAPLVGAATASTTATGTGVQSSTIGLDPPEGIEEPDPGPSTLAGVRYGGPITRAGVILRAKNWWDRRIPYSQHAYAWDNNHGKQYRTDCSGFVSMAWALTNSRVTRTLDAVSTPISWSSLQPGDMLLHRGHHVQLLEKWANSSHTSMWI